MRRGKGGSAACVVLIGAWRRWNIDAGRHAIELMPPADYLRYELLREMVRRAGRSDAGRRASSRGGAGERTQGDGDRGGRAPVTADTVVNVITATRLVPARGCGQPALRRRRPGARPEYQP